MSTVAGTGVAGYNGDGQLATSAQLNDPFGVAVGIDGSVYISEEYGARIRKVDTNGTITTIVGNGVAGFSGDGGPASAATVNRPHGLNYTLDGDLLIADLNNARVRKVSKAGPSLADVAAPFTPSSFWGSFNAAWAGRFCTGGDPVTCFKANFSETIDDLSVPGRGRALHLARTYNVQAAATVTGMGGFGRGWTHSYEKQLTTDVSNGNVTVHDENGSTATFAQYRGVYIARATIVTTLKRNADRTARRWTQ